MRVSMNVSNHPMPIKDQIRVLNDEIDRLRILETAHVEFEIPDRQQYAGMAPGDRLDFLAQLVASLTPEKSRALLEFVIAVGGAAHDKGCPEGESIPEWIRSRQIIN